MKQLSLIALLVLTLSLALFCLTSCDVVENVAGQIPGLEDLLEKLPGNEHVHAFNDATETVTFTNTSGKNLRISAIKVIYEK